MMNSITGKVLKSLMADGYISSKEIAMVVNKSDKTVRLLLRDLNQVLQSNGAHIDMKKGSGFDDVSIVT